MHHPRTIRTGLTILFLLTAIATGYRVYRAATHGWWELITSAVTALLLASSFYAGWRVHKRLRAKANEWRERVQKRQEELLDGEEDRALWESVEPATADEDTCGIGINVVAIRGYRGYPRAG